MFVSNQAEINGHRCKDCGWPVVEAVCADSFRYFKDAMNWDWWYYCSNKGCEHHDGEGVFQDIPVWVEDDV